MEKDYFNITSSIILNFHTIQNHLQVSYKIKVMENLAISRTMNQSPEIDINFSKSEHYWLYGDCY